MKEEKPIKIWKFKNIHLVNKDNDIKFRGPFSYRHLRIAGWIFLLLSQIGTLLGIATKAGLINVPSLLVDLFQSLSVLMAPLFIFASFALVLTAKDGYLRLIVSYALGALGIYVGFIFVYLHYVVGLFSALEGDSASGMKISEAVIDFLNGSGMLTFNIFIDLLLCSLVSFFINYRPTNHFKGNKIYLFRSLVAIPILYEIGSIIVKTLSVLEVFGISPFVVPLLTTKPPVAFLIFIAAALFIKLREKIYLKKDKSVKDYKAFLETNVNRLHFSLFLTISVIIAVVLDLLILMIIMVIGVSTADWNDEAAALMYLQRIGENTSMIGIGKCLPMILIIPIIIFFDYKKTYKNKIVDIAIPVAGVALLIFIYFEGLFDIGRFFFMKMSEKESGQEPVEGIKKIADNIKDIVRR